MGQAARESEAVATRDAQAPTPGAFIAAVPHATGHPSVVRWLVPHIAISDGAVITLVRRWTGTNADEGAFVICSYWLASCLAQAGELDRAREVFEHVTAHANDLGLLAEEIDPRDGSLLGNFPQAFSHVGLITAAARIDQATREQAIRESSEESS